MAALRAARRRHDLGATEVARYGIAIHCAVRGLVSSAYRYFRIDDRALLPDARLREAGGELLQFGVSALNAGRFTAAIRFLHQDNQPSDLSSAALFRTLVWLELGQWSRAHAQAQAINLKELEGDLVYLQCRRERRSAYRCS